MERSFREAVEHRRSYYALGSESPIPEEQIEEIVGWALTQIPSAFNSQSTRIVLLLGESHTRLWNIVKETLRRTIPEDAFKKTESKVDKSFASGTGTVLFFEDQEVVGALQKNFPTYHEKFPEWSEHTSAMHQFAIWVALEDAGFGASLQHYNPLIDKEVLDTWHLPPSWRLIAQMPFGIPLAVPAPVSKQPVDKCLKVFK